MLPALTLSLVVWSGLTLSPSPVFVQASTLRLRAEASATAAVVAELPIATTCTQLLETEKTWAKFDCGGKVGFAKPEFFGQARPDLAKLRATSGTTAERFTAAGRALALTHYGTEKEREQASQVRRTYVALFLETERERRQDVRDRHKEGRKKVSGKCRETNMPLCLSAFTSTSGPSDFWEFDRDRDTTGFIGWEILADGRLRTVGGSIEELPTSGGGQVASFHFRYQLEVETFSAPDLSVLAALSYGDRRKGCLGALDLCSSGVPACQPCADACLKACWACRASAADAGTDAGTDDCQPPLSACTKECLKILPTWKIWDDAVLSCKPDRVAAVIAAEKLPADLELHGRVLNRAYGCDDTQILSALLDAGFDPDAPTDSGERVLLGHHLSAWNRGPHHVLLIKKMKSMAITDKGGRPLLHRLAEFGKPEMIKAAFERGADPKTLMGGRNALFKATTVENAKALIDGGVDPREKDPAGKLPSAGATYSPEVRAFLEQAAK